MIDMVPIILGIISIGLAIGINLYRNHTERKNRIRYEMFFAEQVMNNLKKMSQYFLDVERETTYNEEYEESDAAPHPLKTFYLRNDQEMKDILYQTKLYLPFWSSLPMDDKRVVDEILGKFSWLLYDYYPTSLPESMRQNVMNSSRDKLYKKKNWVINNTDTILQKYNR